MYELICHLERIEVNLPMCVAFFFRMVPKVGLTPLPDDKIVECICRRQAEYFLKLIMIIFLRSVNKGINASAKIIDKDQLALFAQAHPGRYLLPPPG